MLALRVCLLGQLEISCDSQPLPRLPTRNARVLLAYLLLNRDRSHPRDRIAGLFWGDYPEKKASRSLSTALWQIRRILPDGMTLAHDPFTIQLNSSNIDIWLDVEALEACFAKGNQDSLRQAVDLYRGDLLDGFDHDWITIERHRLKAMFFETLAHLIDIHERAGEYQASLSTAQHLLDQDPLREDAHRAAMRAYCHLGQRNAALEQYRSCRDVVQEELGAEPMLETVELYKTIQAGDFDIPSAPVPTSTEPMPRPRHNLPAEIMPFVGRSKMLVQITQLITDPDCRLLTLVGPGGIGKTCLAVEAARRQVDAFFNGIYFVPLQALSDAKQIVLAVADAIGLQFYQSSDPRQRLFDYLREKVTLLVMDNYEHLLDGAPLITEMLQTAHDVKVLATSREKLNLTGETVLCVDGMDFPRQEAADASQYEAVQLFIQRACRVCPGFEPEAGNLRHITHICQLVEGTPLGILLAATWVDVMSPEEIAIEITRDLDFLKTEMRDVPDRHRSIRAVFDHSWERLAVNEQNAFMKLSVFRGSFTREAAEAVAGAEPRTLARLARQSLLRRDPSGYYAVHALLRQYAEEKLNEVPDRSEAVQGAHSAYYIAFLHRQEMYLKGAKQQEALDAIEAELQNVLAGWRWAAAQANEQTIIHSMVSLALFCLMRSRFPEILEAFKLVVERFDETRSVVLGKALMLQGWLYWHSTQFDKGLASFQKGFSILRDLGTEGELVMTLHLLRLYAEEFGGYEAFRQFYENNLTVFRSRGDRWSSAWSLKNLGNLALRYGKRVEAQQFLQESVDLFRALGERWGMTGSLNSLSNIAFHSGEYLKARQYGQEQLAIVKETDDSQAVVINLSSLGVFSSLLHEFEAARRFHEEALAISRELNTPYHIAWALRGLGCTAMLQGEYDEAQRCFQQSLAMIKEVGDPYGGELIAGDLNWLGHAHYELKDYSEARRYFYEALATSAWSYSLLGPAQLLAQEGAKEQAVEILALAQQHHNSSQWVKDKATQILTELETELSPGVYSAACERGRMLDLDEVVAALLKNAGT